MTFQSLHEIQDYLYGFRTKVIKEDLERKFKFSQALAKKLGNPQNKIKVIHAAGTSGKGSTCAIISQLLEKHGKKVGLSISPHLYDLRERMQINNRILEEAQFCQYFNEVYPVIEEMKEHRYGPPSFFEIMIVFAYYVFYREGVDYAVMETGQGGRLDAVNIASHKSKVAVMTKIGLDHIDILGDTLKQVATEKSAIIYDENIVISIHQRPTAKRIVRSYAREKNTQANIIKHNVNYARIKTSHHHIQFDFQYKDVEFTKLDLSLQGIYQVENGSLALAALYEVAKRDGFEMQEELVRSAFASMKTPGRFEELFIEGKRIIIDGAHNPQKMSAFIRSLKKKHPDTKFDFLIGFKKGKDYKDMLKYIVPVAHRIFVSEFGKDDQIDDVYPEPVDQVASLLKDKFSFTSVVPVQDSKEAFDIARHAKNGPVIVTGSLYLISDLYKKIHDMIEIAQEQEDLEAEAQ